jgi:hypothetical protein
MIFVWAHEINCDLGIYVSYNDMTRILAKISASLFISACEHVYSKLVMDMDIGLGNWKTHQLQGTDGGE